MLVTQPWSCCCAGIKSKGTEEGRVAQCPVHTEVCQDRYSGSSPPALSPPSREGGLGAALWEASAVGCPLPTPTWARSPDHSGVEHQLVRSAAGEEMQARSVKKRNKLLSSTDFLRKCVLELQKVGDTAFY